MSLTARAYVLIAAAALLGVASLWMDSPWLPELWRWPVVALLGGLAFEGWQLSRAHIEAGLKTPSPAFLGRAQPARFAFMSSKPLRIEYLPLLPPQCAPLPGVRRIVLASDEHHDAFTLAPVRLGSARCPALPARIAGPLGLAWWRRQLPVSGSVRVTPGTPAPGPSPARGRAAGVKARRSPGAGEQLHQLRAYQAGDPVSRIDWKATARTGTLISRENSAEPQLGLIVAVDMGSSSRTAVTMEHRLKSDTGPAGGVLERYALHASLAARLAQSALAAGERAGLLLYADVALATVAPGRGWGTLARIRAQLETSAPKAVPADPVVAALAIRRLLRQASRVVLLTDLADATERLAQLPRVLGPPHRLIIASAQEPRLAELATAEARAPDDPWIALAAQEHLARSEALQRRLKQRGCTVVSVPPGELEQAILAEDAALRSRARA